MKKNLSSYQKQLKIKSVYQNLNKEKGKKTVFLLFLVVYTNFFYSKIQSQLSKHHIQFAVFTDCLQNDILRSKQTHIIEIAISYHLTSTVLIDQSLLQPV